MPRSPHIPILKKIGPNTWESSPHLLYGTDDQTEIYDDLKEDDEYNSFHKNTIALMKRNADEICRYIGEPFTLIDLGPAYPDKTLPLMCHLRQNRRPFDYVPVDINESWMRAAAEVAKPLARKVQGVNALFEKCASRLPQDGFYKRHFVFVGLTFMNFEAPEILGLMKRIAGRGGAVGVVQELITDEESVNKICNHYKSPPIEALCRSALRHLGVKERDMHKFIHYVDFKKGRMEMGFVLNAHHSLVLRNLHQVPLYANDTLITAVSYRRTPQEFYEVLYENKLQPKFWISPDQTTALAVARL